MRIKGLDAFARKMKELEKAVEELDGDLAQVTFDPNEPASIEQAIQHLNATVDDKIATYAHNDMVVAIADELKENGRKAILERAAAARLEEDDEE